MAKSKTLKVIGYIVLLLAVIGVVGVFAHFTNGFTSDFKTFYVTVGGKDVMAQAGGYTVTEEEPLTVDVKYTFGLASDTIQDYSVKIVPHKAEGKDFSFIVDGETFSFFAEKDLTAGFDVEKGEKSFSITPKGGTITEILQAVYPNKDVGDCDGFTYTDMFTAVITSYNGASAVEINFSVSGKVIAVRLDKGVITF